MVVRGVVGVEAEAEATAVVVRGEAAAAADEGVLQAPIHGSTNTNSGGGNG